MKKQTAFNLLCDVIAFYMDMHECTNRKVKSKNGNYKICPHTAEYEAMESYFINKERKNK